MDSVARLVNYWTLARALNAGRNSSPRNFTNQRGPTLRVENQRGSTLRVENQTGSTLRVAKQPTHNPITAHKRYETIGDYC